MSIHPDLLTLSYDYHLPAELIASRPIEGERHNARLMIYDQASNEVTFDIFKNLDRYLPAKSTLFFNQTKVFKARIFAQKISGGQAEIFFLSPYPEQIVSQIKSYRVMIKCRGKKSKGDQFIVQNEQNKFLLTIESLHSDGQFSITLNRDIDSEFFKKFGAIPIPPYIRKGHSDLLDEVSYQTTFAHDSFADSVAAPTAGLHFSTDLLQQLKNKGHDLQFVKLNVGAGTFKNVETEWIYEHQMHEEEYLVSASVYKAFENASFKVAVGTTTLRALESLTKSKAPLDQLNRTNIFLHPGVEVHSIDALVTNFHLPKSSLIMLVSALIGREKTLELYQLAVASKMRFFSYGDGMLILRSQKFNKNINEI